MRGAGGDQGHRPPKGVRIDPAPHRARLRPINAFLWGALASFRTNRTFAWSSYGFVRFRQKSDKCVRIGRNRTFRRKVRVADGNELGRERSSSDEEQLRRHTREPSPGRRGRSAPSWLSAVGLRISLRRQRSPPRRTRRPPRQLPRSSQPAPHGVELPRRSRRRTSCEATSSVRQG